MPAAKAAASVGETASPGDSSRTATSPGLRSWPNVEPPSFIQPILVQGPALARADYEDAVEPRSLGRQQLDRGARLAGEFGHRESFLQQALPGTARLGSVAQPVFLRR